MHFVWSPTCELARTIGFPQAVLAAAELLSAVRIGSLRQFDELAADLPSLCVRRDEVAIALRAHQQRWDDADRAIGYSATRQEEAAASADEERLIASSLRQTRRLCAASPRSSTC